MPDAVPPYKGDLFTKLRADAADAWTDYVGHDFVRSLGNGSLPEESFRHYLGQDYLFLFHFARAYALAAYKSETLDEMRAATATLNALIDVEMGLHVEYCAKWGITEPEMQALPESRATLAYTRYVLDTGLRGDLLDLHVALAPCVIGYGEIGLRLATEGYDTDNPYAAWIEMYAGDDYQTVARSAVAQLDELFSKRGNAGRYPSLLKIFREACRLESAFWQMAVDLQS